MEPNVLDQSQKEHASHQPYVFPRWLLKLFTPFLKDRLRLARIPDINTERLEAELKSLWPNVWVKIMVQEPWQGTIRFKHLARALSGEIEPWLESPLDFLTTHYGGGKFKINFYAGETFAATQNFRTEGEPLWPQSPEISDEL